jgi:hypothetical protein
MSEYKVDIKFPRQGDPNPNLVVVSSQFEGPKCPIRSPEASTTKSYCTIVISSFTLVLTGGL